MDSFLHNIFGYNTDNYLNKSARIIQRAYRNYKNFQINKIIDIIRNRAKCKDINYQEYIKINHDHWISTRNRIKYKDKNWIFI